MVSMKQTDDLNFKLISTLANIVGDLEKIFGVYCKLVLRTLHKNS